jgi:hypothetical protein
MTLMSATVFKDAIKIIKGEQWVSHSQIIYQALTIWHCCKHCVLNNELGLCFEWVQIRGTTGSKEL